MGLRTLAREVARNASYRMCGTTDMFETNFVTLWVDPRNRRKEKAEKKRSILKRRH